MTDVIVIGGGPAGMLAALSAADLGARTVLATRGAFGGMAANDGPIPVRALSQAARLIRDGRQLGQYGIAVSEPVLDYRRLLARVREVVDDVDAHIAERERIDALGRNHPRTCWLCPLRRPTHYRHHGRAPASGREDHHLHWRREPATACTWIRVHEHS